MSKVFGTLALYEPVSEDASAFYLSYEPKKEADSDFYTWQQVTLWKKQLGRPSFEQARRAIEDDINRQTDERIVSGFVWQPAAGGDPIPVWLSTENQFNFKSAYDLAVQKQGATLPVTFKMGEQPDGTPVYHTFSDMEDADDFYLKAVAYINRCLGEGWARKDSIDWTPYRQALQPVTQQNS